MPTLTAAGRSLDYAWIEGAEPTLVFLHEGLGSVRQWRDFPARLAQASGCRTLLYDRYGYGNSEVLAETRVSTSFMHDEALESLPQVLAALGIEAPVLIGHSDGASIALIHAGAGHPVRGLALMAPHVFVEEISIRSIRQAKHTFESSDVRERLGKYHRDPVKTFYLWNDAWLDPAFRHWNIEAVLSAIRVPVIAIQGEDDEYGTMAQLDAIARQVAGPCELLKLKGCGHSPHRDQPDAVLAALARFVGTLA